MFEIGHPLGDMCIVSQGLSCSAQVGCLPRTEGRVGRSAGVGIRDVDPPLAQGKADAPGPVS